VGSTRTTGDDSEQSRGLAPPCTWTTYSGISAEIQPRKRVAVLGGPKAKKKTNIRNIIALISKAHLAVANEGKPATLSQAERITRERVLALTPGRQALARNNSGRGVEPGTTLGIVFDV